MDRIIRKRRRRERKRTPASEEKRKEALKKSVKKGIRKNILLPVIARLVNRYKAGSGDKNKLDQIFRKRLEKNPKIQDILFKISEDYKEIPENIRREHMNEDAVGLPGSMDPISLPNMKISVKQNYMEILEEMAGTLARIQIAGITPSPEEGLEIGQTITIHGFGFTSSPLTNKIILEHVNPIDAADRKVRHEVNVTMSEPGKLVFRLPMDLLHGAWMLHVEKSGIKSDPFPIIVKLLVNITTLHPPTPENGYPPDLEEIKIEGSGFDPNMPANKIQIFPETGNEQESSYTKTPFRLENGKLSFSIQGIEPGLWKLRISARDNGDSNFLPFPVGIKPYNQPIIDRIYVHGSSGYYLQANPEPGNDIIIHGDNFEEDKQHVVQWVRIKNDIQTYSFVSRAECLSPVSLKASIPRYIRPGFWRIRIKKAGALLSDSYDFPIDWPQFAVVYRHIHCIKESGGYQPGEGGHDEVLTISAIRGDQNVWIKNSDVFTHFDSGDTKPFDEDEKYLYQPAGQATWGTLRKWLLIATSMYEWETYSGDVDSAMQFLGVIGEDISEDISLPDLTAYDDTIYEFYDMLTAAVPALGAFLGDEPDDLGTQVLFFNQNVLQMGLLPGESYVGELNFINKKNVGDYKIEYAIWRKSNISVTIPY